MVQRHGKDTILKPGLSPRKRLIATRFARAQHYDKHAAIQKEICQRLTVLIMMPKQQSVLEIGAGSGQLTRMLAQSIQSERWIINELCQIHLLFLLYVVILLYNVWFCLVLCGEVRMSAMVCG